MRRACVCVCRGLSVLYVDEYFNAFQRSLRVVELVCCDRLLVRELFGLMSVQGMITFWQQHGYYVGLHWARPFIHVTLMLYRRVWRSCRFVSLYSLIGVYRGPVNHKQDIYTALYNVQCVQYSSLKCSGMARVNEGSCSFTCYPHVYSQVEWAIPAFTSRLQSITALLAGTHFLSCIG